MKKITEASGSVGLLLATAVVCIKDNNNSPHGMFHRFLFPFSSKFPHLNFATHVLYIYPCYKNPCVTHTVSLGYLCFYAGNDNDNDNDVLFSSY